MYKIIMTLIKEFDDCDDCGPTSAFCIHIDSSSLKIPSTQLGSANCCSITSASLYDGLKYIFKNLDIDMPYTNLTLKAFEKVGDGHPNTLYDEGKISYKHMVRYLNPRWKIDPESTLEKTAKDFLKKQDIELIIKDERDRDDE